MPNSPIINNLTLFIMERYNLYRIALDALNFLLTADIGLNGAARAILITQTNIICDKVKSIYLCTENTSSEETR